MLAELPTLEVLCQEVLADEAAKYGSKKINELCKRIPSHLLEPILQSLLGRNQITDVALSMFLVPSRTNLVMNGFVKIKNSTLKQIGYSCPNLVSTLPPFSEFCVVYEFYLISDLTSSAFLQMKYVITTVVAQSIRVRSAE